MGCYNFGGLKHEAFHHAKDNKELRGINERVKQSCVGFETEQELLIGAEAGPLGPEGNGHLGPCPRYSQVVI